MAGNDILSRIQVLLDADTADFKSGMQDAKKESKSTFDSIRENANNMAGWVIGAASTAVGGLATMAMQTADTASEIERMSFLSDATTTEFQKMAVGAKFYGVEQDKLSDMLKDFNEKLGEFTSIGAGGGVDFFEQIATQTEMGAQGAKKLALEMQALSGPQALQLYVDKMEEAGVSHEQMSFMLESMASDMTALIPMLTNGGEAMKYWGDLAEHAGAIMDEKTIQSAKELKAQAYALELQMTGMKNQLMQAVIPAFVDIANVFLQGTDTGLKFESVANGIGGTLRWLAKIAIGVATTFQIVGKTIGGIIALGATIDKNLDMSSPIAMVKSLGQTWNASKAVVNEAMADISDTALAAADKINAINEGTASNLSKLAANAGIVTDGVTKGLNKWASDQDKTTSAIQKTNNALQQTQQIWERQVQEASRILYDYADDFMRIERDLNDEISRISSNGALGSVTQSEIINRAKEISEARKQIYLNEYDADLFSWQWTEQQKLESQHRISKLSIDIEKGMGAEERKLRKESIDAQHQYALDQLKLSKQKEMLEIQRYHMTELEFIRENEKLKRQEIEQTLGLTDGERNARLGALAFDTDDQIANVKTNALEDYIGMNADLNGTGEYQALQDTFDGRMEILQSNLMAENISYETYLSERQRILEDYNTAELQLNMSYAQDISGSMLSILADTAGKQSSIYKMMFAADKAYAVASSVVNISSAIAKSANAAFPQNLVQMAIIAAETASIISNIKAVKLSFDGQAHDGIESVPEDGTWNLKKNERVVEAKTSKKLDRTLDRVIETQSTAQRSTAPNVIIHNYGADLKESTNANGDVELEVRVRKIINEHVPNEIANYGSKIHKAVVNHTTANSKRAGA